MGRSENKIFRLNDEIAALEREERLVAEELTFHRLIDDDAQRDAAVSDDPIDRADARQTAADVSRFESVLTDLGRKKEKLIRKRDRLVDRL